MFQYRPREDEKLHVMGGPEFEIVAFDASVRWGSRLKGSVGGEQRGWGPIGAEERQSGRCTRDSDSAG